MRIILSTHSLGMGGAERTAVSLANWLAINNHDVTIMTVTNNNMFYEIDKNVKIISLEEEKISKNLYDAIKNNFNRLRKVRRIIKDRKPQVIFCLDYTNLLYCLFSEIKRNFVVIGTERSNPSMLPKSKIWKFIRYFSSMICDGYIFQTEKAKQYFSKIIQKKSEVIPNAIFNSKVYDIEKIEYVNREKIICSVGRLEYVKGYDILIKAFYKIKDLIPDYKLIIYGEGSERSELEKLIYNLNLNERVFLPGADLDAISKIKETSLFILSSRYEGMPNSLIEAMAIGLPCIATNCNMGPAELINNKKNGILIEVNDEEEMAKNIIKLLKDKLLCQAISKEAYNIRKTHSIQLINTKYLEYFNRVLSKGENNAKN